MDAGGLLWVIGVSGVKFDTSAYAGVIAFFSLLTSAEAYSDNKYVIRVNADSIV